MDITPATPKQISPKVKWATIWAGIAVVITSAAQVGLTSITPEALTFLGPWAGVAQALITLAAGALGGYKAADPARITTDQTDPALNDSPFLDPRYDTITGTAGPKHSA